MAMPRKPDPERYCEFCAERLGRKRLKDGSLESLLHFGRRKFCGVPCMAGAFDTRHAEGTGWGSSHARAREEVPAGACERCGRLDARDVHHRNGDWRNNSRTNLERICRGCHIKAHRPRRSCRICGGLHKGHGLCNRHYIQWREGKLEEKEVRGQSFVD